MTLRSSLARYLRGLLEEGTAPSVRATSAPSSTDPSTPTLSPPPTPSPESTPPTMTPSTSTSPGISAADPSLIEMMMKMHREEIREIRGMVMDILQGREISPVSTADPSPSPSPESPSRMPFDPPDYDAPGTDDLPAGIANIFEREEMEKDAVRQLRTEQEVLALQLAEARAALVDPQGPAFDPSLSTD